MAPGGIRLHLTADRILFFARRVLSKLVVLESSFGVNSEQSGMLHFMAHSPSGPGFLVSEIEKCSIVGPSMTEVKHTSI
jgi:hypothetical protein